MEEYNERHVIPKEEFYKALNNTILEWEGETYELQEEIKIQNDILEWKLTRFSDKKKFRTRFYVSKFPVYFYLFEDKGRPAKKKALTEDDLEELLMDALDSENITLHLKQKGYKIVPC